MKNPLSLAYLTVPDAKPQDVVILAKEIGFTHVGLRLLPAIDGEIVYPIMTELKLLNETLAALKGTGVKIADIEIIRINEKISVNQFDKFFEYASKLGAENITVVGDDANTNRLISKFIQLCEKAKQYNLFLNLEPISWTKVNTLELAITVLKNSNQINSGILIDTFHISRMNTPLEHLKDLKKEWLRIIQVSDAPMNFTNEQSKIRCEARTARLMPGQGDLPIEDILKYMPSESIISVEVPNSVYISSMTTRERAKIAYRETQKILKMKFCDESS